MIQRLIIFALLNFGALALGGLFTPSGLTSEWYQNLNKAPWTPPGWVFGFTWTTIMACLTIYMALANKEWDKKLLILYGIQLVLNIGWTPIFFYFQQSTLALCVIIALTLLIAYLTYEFKGQSHHFVILLLPYLAWLCVATSLNWYIVLKN